MKRLYWYFALLAFSKCILFADTDYAYLGVHTSRLERGAGVQLGLPMGVHLQVDHVAKESPAATVGVQLYDVLLSLDDQILVNPEQLKALVHLRNPGERIDLSILRKGEKISLTVELTNAPVGHLDENRRRDKGHNFFDFDSILGPRERIRDFFRQHSFDFPDPGDFSQSPFFSYPRSGNSFDLNKNGTGGEDPLHRSSPNVQSYSYSSSTQQITVSDEQGTLQWTEKDGLRFLRATDLDGRVVYEGSITTQDDRNKLPTSVMQRLRTMEETGQFPVQ